MKYRLGLDIGIASIGWVVMKHDENEEPCQIVDLGVRKFKPAEKPKTGESPAVDRRNARGIRRNIRRKRGRLDRLKNLLKTNLLNGEEINFSGESVYSLRVKALDGIVSDNDLARIMYSLAKHRGFKSNRKSELQDKNNAKLLSAINKNSESAKSYRTVGEMFASVPKYFETRTKIVDGEEVEYRVYNIRNRDGSFENTLLRDDVLHEITTILEKQREFGNKKLTDTLISEIIESVRYQKSYDEGPNLPSPFHVDFNVGKCTFFKEETRAPKNSFSYEYFNALCDINHMTINGEKLSETQREKLIDAFFRFGEIKYEKVRKILDLNPSDSFGGKSGCNDDKKTFIKSPFTHQMIKAIEFDGQPKEKQQLIDDVGYILSMFKSDEKRLEKLNECPSTSSLTKEVKDNICALDANKFGNLSYKALSLIIPELEKGKVYSKACEDAGLRLESGEKAKKLYYNQITELSDITSPVVRRSVSQTIKLINAVIDKFGSPSAIYVELAREMSKDFAERKQIEKQNEENFANNERIVQKLKELGLVSPSGTDILKYKLYEQQGGKCIYSGRSFESLGLSMRDVMLNNNTQIDHIIPYSRCYDDSFSNKVLVLASENQKKGNNIPFEYFGNDQERWQKFEDLVNVTYEKKEFRSKRERLLRKSLSLEQEQELNNRALNDTRYISKFVKEMLENHLLFDESKKFTKKPVRTINGAVTSFLRKVWGIKKSRFEDDKHHAVDACIISCTDSGMLQRVSHFLQSESTRKSGDSQTFVDKTTGEILSLEDMVARFGEKFQMPYPQFKEEIEIRISENVLDRKQELLNIGYSSSEANNVRVLYVSRMTNHKVTGPMHKQTIKSKKLLDENSDKLIVYTKKPLTSLKLDASGEIDGYPEKFRQDDKVLYAALKKRLLEFKGDAKAAFKDPFYKPTKNGKNMNIVKSVKIQETIGDGIDVNGGLAENGAMIRIDVFEKNDKTYFIPVYTIDYYNKKLPNNLCKCQSRNWPELDDSYTFKCSLFRDDLVKIESAKGINFVPCDKNAEKKVVVFNELFAYYTGADRNTASVAFETVDGKYKTKSVGLQGIKIEKYEIDILGNIHKAAQETRKEFK